MAKIIAGAVLGTYFAAGFGLLFYSVALRWKTGAEAGLPNPLAFIGPSAWAYAFSGRHRDANDKVLTALVIAWRAAILLLPIGIWAGFAATEQ